MYDYGNARLRGARSRLLDRPTLESLVARRDLGHLAATLEEGVYAADLAVARAAVVDPDRDLLEAIDLALSWHLGRTGLGIQSYYGGRARALVRVLLGKRDLDNALAAIRGHAIGADAAAISRLYVLGGELTEEWLERLASASKPDGLRLVARWLEDRSLEKALADEGAMREDDVEAAVVRAYYVRAFRQSRGRGSDAATVRAVLGWQVDVRNLATALRVCRQAPDRRLADTRDLFLAGGGLRASALEAVRAAPTIEAGAEAVGQTPYREAVDEANAYLARVDRGVALERALERILARRAMRLLRADPLGIGVVVGYLAAQAVEVANLRLTARGLALGLDKREIFDEIWLPEA